MRLVVFGAGYVGLVSGTGLSDLGHDVLLYDIDPKKISKLSNGEIPIYEPGLADLVHRNQRNGRLHFATEINAPFDAVDAYFIAVGTPPDASGAADLSDVLAAADTISRVATKKALVVVKSTVPVGTCDKIQKRLEASKVDLEVVSNPEFLKEGDAVNDFFKPDRVVVGVRSDEACQQIRDLYAPLQLSEERLVITDLRSSELIKYAANTMLAIRISFMNEMSRLCHATGADIHSVRQGIGSDSRIGKKFLYAGPGYGGSCFPKDVQALAALGRENGVPMRIAESAHLANADQAHFLAELVEQGIDGGLRGKRIALWGLAFKPETDDCRESPAIKLTHALLNKDATVVAHDPEAGANFKALFSGDKNVIVKTRDYDALDGADALVLLTEWRSYRAPSFTDIKRRLNGALPLVVDARNIWRPADVIRAGLRYQGIGVNGTIFANGCEKPR